MINNWCIIRSGYSQFKGKVGNGCMDVMAKLNTLYGGNGNRIELEAWNDDPDHTADYIHALSSPVQPPCVAILAYSWGCGYGAVELAKSLDAYGINVKYMVLCDPVKYSWAKWRALLPSKVFPWITIKIPPNVREVWWLRQHYNKPSGHDLKATSNFTTIYDPKVLDISHDKMDESPKFHKMCMSVADMLFGGQMT